MSIGFIAKVVDLYHEKKTNLAQSLEPITKLPTIVFCLKSGDVDETVKIFQFSDECLKINSTLKWLFKQGDDRLIKLAIRHPQYDLEEIEVQCFFK